MVQESRARWRLRQMVRWGVLLSAVVLAWPWPAGSGASVILPSLSPHAALAGALALRACGILTLLAAPVLVLAVLFPRWFCRHGCPVGLLLECVERVHATPLQRWRRLPAIGNGILLATLGGACLGYPVFLWLDPLALFQGFLNSWRAPLGCAALVTGLGLPLVLLLNLAWPRLWCQRLCPLGAMQELLAVPGRWGRRLARREAASPQKERRGPPQTRRWFLAGFAVGGGVFCARLAAGHSQPPLRPPGSVDEFRFTGLCLRCGNCAQACPARIIQPDLGASGIAGLLTPTLRFDADYCREDCHRCNAVCPSGAITRMSLSEKQRRVIGPAQLDLEICLLAQGRECTACIRRCPYAALHLETSTDGFSTQPRLETAKCTGCGACEAICPVRPRRAIRVLPRPGLRAQYPR